MKQERMTKSPTSSAYNTRALVRCEATYVGAALPTRTTQPPGIIHEPLEKICEKESLPTLINTPKKPVRLSIFHSGIIIELLFGKHSGELVWYPIQNLYCSAGLQPLKNKHGDISFRTLEDKLAAKSSLKPIFAMVIRETIQKKVLQCHAFAVTRKGMAQLLVQATALAYRDKEGWNQPLNSTFLKSEYNYTLNVAEEVQPDSGYSDHDDVSQKSEQSPQSSELSSHLQYDNQQSRASHELSVAAAPFPSEPSPPPPQPFGDDTESDSQQSSADQRRSQSSPSTSATSATFRGIQSDLNSGDERDDSQIGSVNATSLSSGYPLSQDSSVAAMNHQINPQVFLMQKSQSSTKGSLTHQLNGNVGQTHYGRYGARRLDTLSSLSLEDPPVNNQVIIDSKLKRSKTVPASRSFNGGNANGESGRGMGIDFHQQPHTPNSSSSHDSRFRHYYNEPIYVHYHPEHFMYEGEKYSAVNNMNVDSNSLRTTDYDKHKPCKESRKVC